MNQQEAKAAEEAKTHRKKFTKEEDNLIRQLIAKHGDKNWIIIANYLENRTPRQVRDRWKNYLSPAIKEEPWTCDDDVLLYQLYIQLGPRWAQIARVMRNHTENSVKNRWGSMRRYWTKISSSTDNAAHPDAVLRKQAMKCVQANQAISAMVQQQINMSKNMNCFYPQYGVMVSNMQQSNELVVPSAFNSSSQNGFQINNEPSCENGNPESHDEENAENQMVFVGANHVCYEESEQICEESIFQFDDEEHSVFSEAKEHKLTWPSLKDS